MFKDLWKYQLMQATQLITHMKTDTIKVERQIENLLDRIVETQSPDVARAYENRIHKLGEKKLELTEKCQKSAHPQRTFEEMFERAMTFLSNPHKLWINGCFEEKRTVLKMVFSGELVYHRDKGLRTSKTAMPFKFLEDCENKSRMAHPARFERTTSAFGTGLMGESFLFSNY